MPGTLQDEAVRRHCTSHLEVISYVTVENPLQMPIFHRLGVFRHLFLWVNYKLFLYSCRDSLRMQKNKYVELMSIKFKERGYSRWNINLLSLISPPPPLPPCCVESLDLCSTIGDPITILQTKMLLLPHLPCPQHLLCPAACVGPKVVGRNRAGPCETPRGSLPCSLEVWGSGLVFCYPTW